MNHAKTFAEYVALAEHYKAIGQTDIYLYKTLDGVPWEDVVKVKGGGMHRLSIPVGIEFYADHACGLSFRWTVDLETNDANGKGTYRVDADGVRATMRKLKPAAQQQLADHLRRVVLPAMDQSASEIRDVLRGAENSADCIRGLVAFGDKLASGGEIAP